MTKAILPRDKDTARYQCREACEAHSDLNIFAAIIALLEGGTVSNKSYTTQDQIIRICKRKMEALLKLHDRAVNRVCAKAGEEEPYP